MNAEQLLQHFERISEAPDAIPRLRRFILDLAVRGKLVEQNPTDTPVSQLLNEIAERKARAVDQRSVRASKKSVEQVEAWCAIPDSWHFVRLDKVANVVMGSSPPGSTYNKIGEGVPLINGPVEFTPGSFGRTLINQYTTAPTAYCNEGDFLICVRGSTTGRTNVAAFRACVGRGVAAIQPLFEDQFIRLAIRVRQEAILQMGRGIAFPSISRDQLAGLPIPLPPLAEQHRIVTKVDELMSLCDQLEAAKAEREQCRDSLVAASLQGLNQPAEEEETFREHARFTFNNLPRITTRTSHIKQLRQTILNLAVRGKLVEQDPGDEPAAELLKRIAAEKARLVKAGKARKLEVDPVTNEEISFPVPSNWVWTRLGSIGDWGSGSTPSRGNSDLYGGGITWLKSGELNDNRALEGSKETVSKLAVEKGSFRINKTGDVLIAMYGATIGKVAILAESAVTNQAICGCTPFPGVFNQYLYFYLLSQRAQFHSASEGGAQPNISKIKIIWTTFPLPPLAEQHRIVAKVDELMAICDQLEAQITATEQDSRRFLESVLADALAPGIELREVAEVA